MSETTKKWSSNVKDKARRRDVIDRLTTQLASGVKTMPKTYLDKTLPLTEADKKRINNELETLKNRI